MNLLNGFIAKEFEWCGCGKPKDHLGKCLSFKLGDKRDKIGKWSGKSKSVNSWNDYK